MNTLAVIIPAYNAASTLGGLLKSICQQLVEEVEVVVIDDGSTDDTYTVAHKFASERIHVVSQENQGVGAARNRGIEECDAEYIWFVDADDDITAHAIATILNACKEKSSDIYLFGALKKFHGKEQKILNTEEKFYSNAEEIALDFDKLFTENLLNPLWNKVFRKKLIQSAGILFSDSESGEDVEFVLHFLCEARSMYVIRDILYKYRLLSTTSSSHSFHQNYVVEHERMFDALCKYCRRMGISAKSIKSRWSYDTALGFRMNIRNSIKECSYHKYREIAKSQYDVLSDLLEKIGGTRYLSGYRLIMARSWLISYMYLKCKESSIRGLRCLSEIRNNPGVLPKVLVCIVRFGMWSERIRPKVISLPFKLLYCFIDLIFCKLLLNCDIPAKAHIGYGLKIYHPYCIFINDAAVIGDNFTCRGQVTIGNKGAVENDGSPIIGDNVDVGVGAKIIGPINIGSDCVIGANAVVVRSFGSCSVLVGVPAREIDKR